jgi:hypothetical protein
MVALVCVLGSACGPEAEVQPEQGSAEPVAEVVEDGPAPEPGLRPFLSDEMQRSTRPESFAHDAHQQIDCAVCHDVPRGHGSHAGVECADCHRASANTTLVTLSPDQCQSCHHGTEQALSCEVCHQSRPTLTSAQELHLEVWSAPRTRSLDFDHGLHEGVECASCHQALPALTPAEPCASCHAEHHTAEATCSACHAEAPPQAHDVEVHLTCSGSGCHRAPEVEAIATTRSVCVSCHLEQQEHEPEGDCIECHRVRGDTTAWTVWSHP